MAELNIKEIKAQTDIVQIIGKYVILKKDGPYFIANCPFHDGDSTPSFKIKTAKQSFKCYGCGKSGDVFDFLYLHQNMDLKASIKMLTDPHNIQAKTFTGTKLGPVKQDQVNWKQLQPEKPYKENEIHHYKHGKPVKVWPYHYADGKVMGLVCRFEWTEHNKIKKDVLPYVYATNGTASGWTWLGFDKPRPLYNLHLLAVNPDKTVIMCEGEKTADAINANMDTAIATTWPGGADGILAANFMPLKGRKILLWPDNDKVGHEAMQKIAKIIADIGVPVLKWIRNPEWAPAKWDAADKQWTKDELRELIKVSIIELPIVFREPKAPEVKVEKTIIAQEPEIKADAVEINGNIENDEKAIKADVDPTDERHFRVLGYQKDGNGNLYHFYSYNSKSVISLTPSAMSKPNLLQLAPIRWWERWFKSRSGSFSLEAAQNWIINKEAAAKVFSAKWIRGRGAWLDNKKVVIHAGDRLIVDSKTVRMQDWKSKYVYEIGEDIGFNNVKPLTTKEANKFMDMVKAMSWAAEKHGLYFAGWCIVAPICGALSWRPHVWLHAKVGTGKSWTLDSVVIRVLGPGSLHVQGATTEPGLRQTLRYDAIPVVFDEAEGHDKKAQDRMQDVLTLARQASSPNGGNILMGGSGNGGAKNYSIRSCFLYASVVPQASHQSDQSRITEIVLQTPADDVKDAQWERLLAIYNSIMTDEYCERLRARTIKLMPVILKNSVTFAKAAAKELGAQRAGDQLGSLLAGAYSLSSERIISDEEAIKWIQTKDWTEEKNQDVNRDEVSLIQYLMNQTINIEYSVIGSSGKVDRTVGELCMYCGGLDQDVSGKVDIQLANERLRRMGIKVEGNYIIICNTHDTIQKLLLGTAWYRNYNKILVRLDGAEATEKTTFASGVKMRATKIPLSTVFLRE